MKDIFIKKSLTSSDDLLDDRFTNHLTIPAIVVDPLKSIALRRDATYRR